MILVEPEVKLIEHEYTLEGMYRDIERAARICYASEANSKNTLDFIKNRLIARHHYRPLEFGTCYLTVDSTNADFEDALELCQNHYSQVTSMMMQGVTYLYITTNYRVLVENDLEYLIKYYTAPTVHHSRRYTFLWTISRGIADEFRTHTTISSLMQSTRYCCYANDKFGNQLRIVRPQWFAHTADEVNNAYAGMLDIKESVMIDGWRDDEARYKSLVQLGAPAQAARGILPLDLRTEFIQCGYPEDWHNFFNQRAHDSTGPAHPDAKYIALKAEELYLNNREGN